MNIVSPLLIATLPEIQADDSVPPKVVITAYTVAQTLDDRPTIRKPDQQLPLGRRDGDLLFPWYDPASGQYRPPNFLARPPARTLDRADIEEQSIAPNTTPANRPAANPTGPSGITSTMIWSSLVVALVLLVALLAIAFFRAESRPKRSTTSLRARSTSESIAQLSFDLESEPGDFRQLAERAFQRNEFDRAMIYLFSHVLVTLDQNHQLQLQRGKTNGQYLRELKSSGAIVDYYRQTMLPFEAVFYGRQSLAREEFETCWKRLPDFLKQLEQNKRNRSDQP